MRDLDDAVTQTLFSASLTAEVLPDLWDMDVDEAKKSTESAITMVIQAMDLGIIVPTAFLTASLLIKKQAWGYALSSVMLLKVLTMGAALISMIIVQFFAGVEIDPVTSIIFILVSI